VNASACGYRLTREDCFVIAGAGGLSVVTAYVVVQQPELFNLAGVASARGFALLLAGLVLGGISLRFPHVALCCLVAFVALNLSDVLVRGHGLPSLLQLSFVPLALAGWWNARRGSRFPPRTLTLLLCGYLVIVMWSTTIAADRDAADVRLFEHLRGFAVFVVVVMLAQSAVALRRAAWTFVLCLSLLGGLALVQVLTGDFTRDFGGLARIKYAQVYGTTFEPRIAGPLGDPNFFAQILVMAVPIALYVAYTADDTRRRVLGFGAAGVVSAATVFTYSRGGALALAVVLVACVLARGINLRKASLGVVPVLVLLWLAMPDDFARRLTTLNQLLPGSDEVLRPDSSFGERRLFAAAAWRMFEDAPLLGVGAGNYGVHFVDYAQRVGSDARLYVTPTEGYYPHNLYLEVAAETGVIGLVLFISVLAVCFAHLWRARIALLAAGARSSAGLVTGCAIALIGYLLTSVFLHGHFIRYWWLLVGFAAAAHKLVPDGQEVRQDAAPTSIPTWGSTLARELSESGDDAIDPTVAPSVRPAIAVLLSRFPLITETFILREIIEMERQGQPVLLVPLLRQRTAVVHREAEAWIGRAVYTPFISMPILLANVRMLLDRPRRYLLALWRVAVGTIASPNFLIRSLALFPKAVFLAERLEREGIRHLHAHYATHPTTVALIISWLSDVTFSFTVHAHDIFVRRTLLRKKLEAAAFVRSISGFNRDFLARRYPDALMRKVHVVHVGIDPENFVSGSDEQPGPDRPRILCVASLQRYKGIPVLIDACRLLRQRGTELTCTIVGEGPMRPALERQIRELGLEHIVTLAGARPQHKVAALMRSSSLFVIPSIVAPDGQMEGIPVALMEAMASRLPVVASSLSGIPEAVEHGTTGILVEPGSASECARAIERVLADALASRQMGDRARSAIERGFRLDDCVSELLRRIDCSNPPPHDARLLRLPALQSGVASGTIGLRRLQERRDSRVAQLLVANGRVPHEVVLKIHKSRKGESRPPLERARKEFELLHALRDAAVNGSSVPRPLYLDEKGAGVLMESCRGEPLDVLIRTGRFTRGASPNSDLTSAVRRTGTWLRNFQETTTGGGNPAGALDRLVETCTHHLEECRGNLLPASAAKAVRFQLDALKTRLAPASLRLTKTHQDFWPGNVFVADEIVEVIDFEGTDEGLPYEDVAYFLVQLEQFFPGPILRSQFRPLGAAFLAGYLPHNHGFDWTAYELCRIASALKILRMTPKRAGGLRAHWRRRMLRGIIVGEAA
jgi:colanic acid/amylovoran biosynthesis glycosyltransferase